MLWKGYVGGALVDFACECGVWVGHWYRLMAEYDHELCFRLALVLILVWLSRILKALQSRL
jgi:hypothetical protein